MGCELLKGDSGSDDFTRLARALRPSGRIAAIALDPTRRCDHIARRVFEVEVTSAAGDSRS